MGTSLAATHCKNVDLPHPFCPIKPYLKEPTKVATHDYRGFQRGTGEHESGKGGGRQGSTVTISHSTQVYVALT